MKRCGAVIMLRPDKTKEYLELHESVWPAVKNRMTASNIHNYTIFFWRGWLFNYFEYTGTDYAADMQRIAADPVTQRWWELCMPCQEQVENLASDDWWTPLEEIYHQD